MRNAWGKIAAAVATVALATAAPADAAPEKIKIGLIHNSAQTPIYLALDRGYFAAEDIEATIVPFDAAQPIAVAVASGDVDFGSVGATGGLYNLAGQGAIKIIGGNSHEVPGFHLFGLVAASPAYEAGLRSVKDLAGRSVAVTQIGGGYHYAFALLAEKYAVDLNTVRILPLQSIPNIASALTGGQTPAAMLNSTASAPLQQRGTVKLIAWSGDETPYQATVLFTSSHDADERHAVVERFLRAYKKGAHEYTDAFVGSDGRRANGPTAGAITAVIAQHAGIPPDQVALGIAYVDADARLDVHDILHQVAWFRSQAMVKTDFDPMSIIDQRYAVPLPND